MSYGWDGNFGHGHGGGSNHAANGFSAGGSVNSGGGKIAGCGFTVVRTALGTYQIVLNTAIPAVQLSFQVTTRGAVSRTAGVVSFSDNVKTVTTYASSTEELTDTDFDFVAFNVGCPA